MSINILNSETHMSSDHWIINTDPTYIKCAFDNRHRNCKLSIQYTCSTQCIDDILTQKIEMFMDDVL